MWTCPKCRRIFRKTSQPHSCKSFPLNDHFKNKSDARDIFDHLVSEVNHKIGKNKIISLPCCIHLYGKYEYLAALPKKDRLEVRFALDRKLNSSRLKVAVPLSASTFKNCIDISKKDEVDNELIDWLKQSFFLKG